MSERMTTAEEHAETIREFVLAQEEPSDFVLSALAAMEGQIKALADALWDHGDVYGDDGWHRYGCPLADMHGGNCGERCQKDRAALRLAGRL